MPLRPLPEGLAPDVVEKLRWEAFAHKRSYRLRSREDLLRFTQKRGFVLEQPARTLPSYPTALEAVVGRPLLEFAWDERLADLVAWRDANLRTGHLVCASFFGPRVLFSLPALADFLAATMDEAGLVSHQKLHAAGCLGEDAAALCAALEGEGPASDEVLRARLGVQRRPAMARYAQALQEASRKSLLVVVDHHMAAGQSLPVYDLTARACKPQVAKARALAPEVARERVVLRYYRNVLASWLADVVSLLGWDGALTGAACESLVRKRKLYVHPASRPNRPFYQATSTDLIDPSTPVRPTTEDNEVEGGSEDEP